MNFLDKLLHGRGDEHSEEMQSAQQAMREQEQLRVRMERIEARLQRVETRLAVDSRGRSDELVNR